MLTLNEADKLLMIPGPTPVQREILSAIGEPTISHTSDEMADIVSRCLAALLPIAGSDAGRPFVFGGAGTLAQEAAIVNLLRPGDRLLVVSNGYFGDRFVGIAEAHGIEVERLAAPWGESITADALTERMAGGRYAAVTITQVETSTGALAPVGELATVAKEAGALVIVDAVCAFGGVPADMDERGIDILLTGAQKALGVPPGLAILIASPAAMEQRRSLGRVDSYYCDLLNWEPSMADPHVYFSTHAVNLFYALQAGLEIIVREGLEARFERHLRLARGFRAGMAALGFEPLTDPAYFAPTLSVLAYPEGVEDVPFRGLLGARGVVAAACLGDFKGRGLRFGHMGNITEADILRGVAAVEGALGDLGQLARPGAGVAAAQETFSAALATVEGARVGS